jgi:hypothetical protein
MLKGRQFQTRLSLLGSVVLCLGVAFVLSLVAVGAGYMAQQQGRERLADFAADSVAGAGTVSRKFTEVMNGNTLFYDLEASFTAADGSKQKQSFRVPPAIYNRYSLGGSVPVTYVKSKPWLFYIPGAEPDDGSIATMRTMGNWFLGASIVLGISFLVGLGLALMSRRSAGTGTGGGGVARQSARVVPGYRGQGFGARQVRR